MPTATPTPTPSFTPTPTPTSTATATKAPTATRKPTQTPEPVEMPSPAKVIFQDNFDTGQFDNGVASRYHWNAPSLEVWGAKLDIVVDPTNSEDSSGRDRGFVMRVINDGDPVPIPGWTTDGYWRAAYPVWFYFNENLDGDVQMIKESAGMQVDAWIDPNIGTVSVIGGHRLSTKGDATSVAAIEVRFNTGVAVLARDGEGRDHRVDCREGLYQPGAWNTFTLIVDAETGRVLPFINGIFALRSIEEAPKVPVDDVHPGSFSDAHAGVNCWSPTRKSYTNSGTTVLNDNFMVFTIEGW
ncbi:hypothetical protein ACFLYD_01455 [Chloroflexota bacterium]